MSIDADLSRAPRTPAERRQLIAAVRDAQTGLELDWIEWKSSTDLTEKKWKVDVARHIMGFANRDPDAAASTLGGSGILLLGVAPGQLEGVDLVDSAVLEDAVSEYTGRDGPRWSPDYETVDEKTVLVVTVEPPQWGDRIFAFEKEFEGYHRGFIPVRRVGKTERADAADLRVLTKRVAAGPPVKTLLAVGWEEEPADLPSIDLSSGAVDAWVATERRRLLARLDGSGFSKPVGSLALESRSPEEYRGQVEEYVRQLDGDVLRRRLLVEAAQEGKGALALAVTNQTEHNLDGVLVELQLPGQVMACFDDFDATDGRFLPAPPIPWGTSPFIGIPGSLMKSRINRGRSGWVDNSGSARIVYEAFDLRPRYRYKLDTVFAVAGAEHAGEPIRGRWHATSKNQSGLVEGELHLQVSSEARKPAQFLG